MTTIGYNRSMSPRCRVLFFRPSLGDGGADRVTVTLLRHLDRRLFEPSLALVRASGELLGEVPADVPVIDLGARRLSLAVPALARLIRSEAPDTVMCTSSGANVIAVAAHRLARSRSRLVLSERSAVTRDRGALRNLLERRLKQFSYPFADEVTAVCDGVADDLVEILALPRSRVRVVYNPVIEPQHRELAAAPVDHPWFGNGAPTLVAVGRLVDVKDYPTMLSAFARIRAQTGARLVILGKGPLKAGLERHAAELGLAQHVAFVGFDPNPLRFVARAALLLQTSTAEGLPGTIIQSMACGTPVVSTDCAHGPREIIRDGVDGYLVSVGDARAVAERAIHLLAQPELRASFAAAAAISARRFELDSSMRRYEAAITGTVS